MKTWWQIPYSVSTSSPLLIQSKSNKLWYPSVDALGNLSWSLSCSTEPPGMVNIKGPKGKDGQCSCDCITFVGDWRPNVNYSKVLNGCSLSVSHGGTIYKCIKTNKNKVPNNNPEYWSEII